MCMSRVRWGKYVFVLTSVFFGKKKYYIELSKYLKFDSCMHSKAGTRDYRKILWNKDIFLFTKDFFNCRRFKSSKINMPEELHCKTPDSCLLISCGLDCSTPGLYSPHRLNFVGLQKQHVLLLYYFFFLVCVYATFFHS